jgi:hypothetical protein
MGEQVMEVYEYEGGYEEYKKIQTAANKRKNHWQYVQEETIRQIVNLIPEAKSVLCHGTRNGTEQRMFKKHLPSAYVIGSEISDNAKDFDMTVQHDFMDRNEEWLNRFDIVYSNSFDHSIRPIETLKVWSDQLSDDGALCLEWCDRLSIVDPVDPLSASLREIETEIINLGFRVTNRITRGPKHSGVVLVCKKAQEIKEGEKQP